MFNTNRFFGNHKYELIDTFESLDESANKEAANTLKKEIKKEFESVRTVKNSYGYYAVYAKVHSVN